MESLSICSSLLKQQIIDRTLVRIQLLNGSTIEESVIEDLQQMQRELLKAKEPKRDKCIREDIILGDVMDAFDEPKAPASDFDVPNRVPLD